MHTSKFVTDMGPITVIHNSDWSGEVDIVYMDGDGEKRDVTLPGELLIALGKKVAIRHVLDNVTSLLENMEV